MSLDNTPFDDVFKTLLVKCSNLIIPVINEVFYTSYDITEKVQLLNNELFAEDKEGDYEKNVTDSYFKIRNKTYHVECQSTPDSTMVMRMVEYDFQHALADAEIEAGRMTMHFPESAVLYLRHTRNTPDNMCVTMILPRGKTAEYVVPVVKVKDYTKEDILNKELYFFVPYYILKFERKLEELNEDEKQLQELSREYEEIYNGLKRLESLKKVNEVYLHNLIQLTNALIKIVARNQENIKKEVCVMGGKVLELESDKIREEGREVGREEGRLSVITEFVKNGYDAQEACRIAKVNYLEYCKYAQEPLCVREEINYNSQSEK